MNNMDRIDWNLSCYVDSYWAGDPQTRKIISGWVIFVGKIPIVWGSKQQRIVVVSSSEAEFLAISDVCKDLVFSIKFIEFMGVKIRLPVTVMVIIKVIYLWQTIRLLKGPYTFIPGIFL